MKSQHKVSCALQQCCVKTERNVKLTPRRACEPPNPAVNLGANGTALEGKAAVCPLVLADRLWQLHLACIVYDQIYAEAEFQRLFRLRP